MWNRGPWKRSFDCSQKLPCKSSAWFTRVSSACWLTFRSVRKCPSANKPRRSDAQRWNRTWFSWSNATQTLRLGLESDTQMYAQFRAELGPKMHEFSYSSRGEMQRKRKRHMLIISVRVEWPAFIFRHKTPKTQMFANSLINKVRFSNHRVFRTI